MTIYHDGPLDIATGRFRSEKFWKNAKTTWGALVARLRNTQRTAEPHAEYMILPKGRQDEIKDIGGFVGGYLSGGRRKSANVLHRQLITLDLDFPESHFWDEFTLLYGCAAVLYSTHKHSPQKPRLRLIIPLDREVASDEYVAIARRIAGTLGIDAFDDTTYQAERLMYWPSTSADGVYLFEVQDGAWLKADDVLSSYRNWRDASEWPVSSRHTDKIRRAADKQGDPYEKPGVIGAFNRLYSIEEAIGLYLADVYTPTDMEGRFTYVHGSTSGGLVVYEDKFAYSHHGTDPVSGRLCNAFDLVRLHLFGLKDEGAADGTPINRYPSYVAMQELCTKDETLRVMVINERLDETREAFAGIVAEVSSTGAEAEAGAPLEMATTAVDDPAGDDWKKKLDIDKNCNILTTIDNTVLILENDPLLRGAFMWDEFDQRPVVTRRLPWRGIEGAAGRFLRDTDDDNLAHYLEKIYRVGNSKLEMAMGVLFERHRRHPVRAYLKGLEWDGRPRVDSLLCKYLGAEDDDYTRAVTRKVLAAAVARVFDPGCKFDYALVLVGNQGDGKSTLLAKLGRQWFSDSFNTVHGKEAYEQLQGVWIMEMAELAGFKRAEVESIKNFISKRADRYRVAYGRRLEDFPRQSILVGTSNRVKFIEDETGGRRFWGVLTDRNRRKADPFYMTEAEVNQVWAEAVAIYRAGEPLFLDEGLEAEANERQRGHTVEDARADLVREYLEKLLPVEWPDMDVFQRRQFLMGASPELVGIIPRDKVSVSEVWCECLGGSPKDMTPHNTKPLHALLRQLPEWEEGANKSSFGAYGLVRAYWRKGRNKG
jgi:putative DNA primase/helicase